MCRYLTRCEKKGLDGAEGKRGSMGKCLEAVLAKKWVATCQTLDLLIGSEELTEVLSSMLKCED